MLFTSYGFIAFITALFLLYYIIPKRFQWMLLLIGSMLFYAFSGLTNLIYIGVTIITTWYAALQITRIQKTRGDYAAAHKADMDRERRKAYKEQTKKKTRLWFLGCLLLNLGILAVIKYTDFVLSNVNSLFDGDLAFMNFAVPLGISYYTFKSMGYLIDVNRGRQEAQGNIAKFALFVSFFPQVIQGPISRYDKLSETLFAEHSYDRLKVRQGLTRVLWGFFKKLVIADRLLPAVKTLSGSPEQYQGAWVLVLILFYAIELYGDFTGGIDIAIGIGQMLGVDMEENFVTPYFSKNINEYWTRWHITMGTWFKDYIFYPISVSGWMLKLSKGARARLGKAVGKRVPVYLANIIVWFATGLWHGAAWNFIVWGLLNCVVTVASYEAEPLYKKFHGACRWSNTAGYDIFQMFRTFWLMGAIRILDVYRDVPLSFSQLGSIFSASGWSEVFSGGLGAIGLGTADYVVTLIGCALMLAVSILYYRSGNKTRPCELLVRKPAAVQAVLLIALLLAVIILGAYGVGYDSTQFIYNQF